jgi:hypothetical protein
LVAAALVALAPLDVLTAAFAIVLGEVLPEVLAAGFFVEAIRPSYLSACRTGL